MTDYSLQYRLRLGNGDSWSISIAPGSEEFGEKFASLLGLDRDSSECDHTIQICPEYDEARTRLIESYSDGPSGNKVLNSPMKGFTGIYNPGTGNFTYLISSGIDEGGDADIIKIQLILSNIFLHVIKQGGLVLHGALLSHPVYGGVALLAPGGTGKSTCARRIVPPWTALCDDMILVVRTHSGSYSAHPLPTWSEVYGRVNWDRTWPIESHVPMERLYFLQRGKNDKILTFDKVNVPLWLFESGMQALTWHLRNLQRLMDLDERTQSDLKALIFGNCCDIALHVPSHILKAAFGGQFWKHIEQNFFPAEKIGSMTQRENLD